MKKFSVIQFFICFVVLVLMCGTSFAQMVGGRSSYKGAYNHSSNSSGGFSGYIEEMNIFNVGEESGDLYSLGLNLSFGKEFNDKLYVGGGISIYYMTQHYYYYDYDYYDDYYYYSSHWESNFAMDFFADVKYKFLDAAVTPIVGCKLGFGFCSYHYGRYSSDEVDFTLVTRPSIGVLFRLRGHNELMLNVEYLNAAFGCFHGVCLNLGYKFGK